MTNAASASPNAIGPTWIAWVNPTSAITGAAKRSPIAIATPSGCRRASTP